MENSAKSSEARGRAVRASSARRVSPYAASTADVEAVDELIMFITMVNILLTQNFQHMRCILPRVFGIF